MEPRTDRLLTLLAWMAIVVHLGVLAFLVTEVPIGADERVYLLAGRSLLEGTDWSVREELFQGPIPLWANQVFAGDLSDLDAGTIRARYGMLPFSLILLLCIRGFATEVAGRRAGLLAVALAAFSPAFLAWGPQLTVDTSLTALMTLAWWMLWRWLQRPGLAGLGMFGVALGLAFATKYSALVLSLAIPLVVVAACLRGFDPTGPKDAESARPLFHRLGWSVLCLGGALALAVVVLHAAYGFRAPRFDPAGFEYLSGLVGGLARIPGTELLFSLLPKPFLEGIDYQASVSKELIGTFGTRMGSHWAYYPMTLVTKLPVATMALFAVSVALARTRGRATELVWLLPTLVFLAYMSFLNNLQGGLRYLLPLLPLLQLRASVLAGAEFGSKSVRKVRDGFVLVMTAWLLVSSIAAFPFYTGYFNELAGGPVGGMRWFGGQNCDWLGQYRQRGREELSERHPSIVFLSPAGGPRFGQVAAYVADLKQEDPFDSERTYHWLDRFEPVEHYATAWFVYEIEASDFDVAIDHGDQRALLDLAVAEVRAGDFDAARSALEELVSTGFAARALQLRTAIDLLERAADDPAARVPAAQHLAGVGHGDLALPLLESADDLPAALRFQVLYEAGAEREALDLARRIAADRPLQPAETLVFATGMYWQSKVLEADELMASQEPPPEGDPLRQKWDELRAEIGRVADSRRRMKPGRSGPDIDREDG